MIWAFALPMRLLWLWARSKRRVSVIPRILALNLVPGSVIIILMIRMVVTISIPGIGIIVIMIVIGHLDCQNTSDDLWSDLLIISSTH